MDFFKPYSKSDYKLTQVYNAALVHGEKNRKQNLIWKYYQFVGEVHEGEVWHNPSEQEEFFTSFESSHALQQARQTDGRTSLIRL